ncbi:MAG: response regulator, partial [Gemmatimonadales bacterium]|nr:response regulator [Gemmatimonadales bacterium]
MATIYLADPDEGYRKGLAHALRRAGHGVTEFSSGSELYAGALADEPDLIVMETDLEEMDGFQVFALLQRDRAEPFPALFVTAFENPRVARVCKQRGALGYVGKNRPLDQVVTAVQAYFTDHDPLYDRKLSAALAWLQSRGKSGRLDLEGEGEIGYVLLHRGKVLEARWRSAVGEEAVRSLSEEGDGIRFRFAEGTDEIELPADLRRGMDEGAGRAPDAARVAAAAPPALSSEATV